MNPGDTAFLIESNRFIREVKIVRCTGGLYLIRYKDGGGGIQVKKHRLYPTKEAAEGALVQTEQKPHRTPYDYM